MDLKDIKTIKDFNEYDYNNNSWTYFHTICNEQVNLKIIKHCVNRGADFNIKNDNGNTPFSFICMDKTTKDVLEYCLKNGADLTIENNIGYTPLDILKLYNPSLVPFVEELFKKKSIIPKIIIGTIITGIIYKISRR